MLVECSVQQITSRLQGCAPLLDNTVQRYFATSVLGVSPLVMRVNIRGHMLQCASPLTLKRHKNVFTFAPAGILQGVILQDCIFKSHDLRRKSHNVARRVWKYHKRNWANILLDVKEEKSSRTEGCERRNLCQSCFRGSKIVKIEKIHGRASWNDSALSVT